MGMGSENPGLEPSDHSMEIGEDLDGPLAIPEYGLRQAEPCRHGTIEVQAIRADRGIMAEFMVEEVHGSVG